MIKTPVPNYDSTLTETIMWLERFKGRAMYGTARVDIFVQLKELFHLIEALASARIEGNHTTLSAYLADKEGGRPKKDKKESIREIDNLIESLNFIDENIDKYSIDKEFILELQKHVVAGLKREGDDEAGNWRTKEVSIAGSEYQPPNHYDVPDLMKELIEYINQPESDRYNLLRIAISHHRFVWIHPFNNGNGRTARLLTYAMLCKNSYILHNNLRLFNPTAVFACNRQKYYALLSEADKGTDEGILNWCEYMLDGIKEEIERTQKLADANFVNEKILLPAVTKLANMNRISDLERRILRRAIQKGIIKTGDIGDLWEEEVSRVTISTQVRALIKMKLLRPLKKNGREYTINFVNSPLTALVLLQMDESGLLPVKMDEV